MKIIEWCLKNALLLNLLTVAVLVIGIFKTTQMKKEAFPAVDFDVVVISTVYPGASPREVEHYVTNMIEDEIRKVDGLDHVESTSIEGLSTIVVYLDPERDDAAKVKTVNDIQRAVDRLQDLPQELPNPPLVQSIDSGDMPVIELALSGPIPFRELHQIAEDLEKTIENLPDVKEVLIRGWQEREFWVEVDPDKLTRYNIGLSLIVATLESRNLNLPGGVLRNDEGDLLVRTIGELKSAEEIAGIVLRTNDAGVQIRIKDVGRVISTFEETMEEYRTNGHPSINLLITKKATGDIINLVESAKEATSAFLAERQLDEVRVSYVNDMSLFVKARLEVLLSNGYIGVFLVLVTLLLTLSKSIALVTALGMPVALFGALAIMAYMGMTINLISMFGLVIVLGMLVDDAIIVAENIWQYYEKGEKPWDAAIKGATEVMWPVTATIATTIAAFTPLLMVSGIFGKFIIELPQVVIIALLVSLLEALFVLPSHAYDTMTFLEKRAKRREEQGKERPHATFKMRATEAVVGLYGKALGLCLKLRYLLAGSMFMALIGCLWLVQNKMQLILFPSEGVESFFVRVDQPLKTPLVVTSEKVRHVEKVIASLPPEELRDFVTHVGKQEDDPHDPFGKFQSNLAQIQVFLTPEAERTRTADQIIEDLRQKLAPVAAEHGFTKYFFSQVRTGPPVGKPVAIRIIGEDLEKMDAVSDEVQRLLAEVPGVSDIDDNFHQGKDEFQVLIDEAAASRALLSVRDIALHVRAAIEGQIATHIRDEGDRIAVRVRYAEKHRNSIDDLMKSRLVNQAGFLVPLESVATFERRPGLQAIIHHNYDRTITVTASIDEMRTSSTSVNEAIRPALDRLAKEHPGIHFEAGGEFEDTDESMASLMESFYIALALIFLILATQFKSLTQPILVMAAIPFGAIGVILAFYLHGLPLSFIGMVGFVGLAGVVVNDSIVLVDFINNARRNGMSAFEATLYAGGRRFRAVWLTTLTTIFGLLPLVYGIGGEDKFLMPAAAALSYGLLVGTVLILFLVPALYLIRVDMGKVLLRIFPVFGK